MHTITGDDIMKDLMIIESLGSVLQESPRRLIRQRLKQICKDHGVCGKWVIKDNGKTLVNKITNETFLIDPKKISDEDLLSLMKLGANQKPSRDTRRKVDLLLVKNNSGVKRVEPKTAKEKWEMVFGSSGLPRASDYADDDHGYIELDRFRRHDHGGGEDGDDWLPDEEIEADYEYGAKKYGKLLRIAKDKLKQFGYDPNEAGFDLGEKGHFRLWVNFKKLKGKLYGV